jgi:hypothetical protein
MCGGNDANKRSLGRAGACPYLARSVLAFPDDPDYITFAVWACENLSSKIFENKKQLAAVRAGLGGSPGGLDTPGKPLMAAPPPRLCLADLPPYG